MLGLPETDPANLDAYAQRALADYQNLSIFIRVHAPQDPDVQAAANAVLNHYRILIGKLTHLCVTMEDK